MSSDKNSSIFKARGLAALPAAQGMCLHPPGCGGRSRMSCGLCASDPHPTHPLWHGASETVVQGSGIALSCSVLFSFMPKSVLELPENRNQG